MYGNGFSFSNYLKSLFSIYLLNWNRKWLDVSVKFSFVHTIKQISNPKIWASHLNCFALFCDWCKLEIIDFSREMRNAHNPTRKASNSFDTQMYDKNSHSTARSTHNVHNILSSFCLRYTIHNTQRQIRMKTAQWRAEHDDWWLSKKWNVKERGNKSILAALITYPCFSFIELITIIRLSANDINFET